jgi:hypothetical protein
MWLRQTIHCRRLVTLALGTTRIKRTLRTLAISGLLCKGMCCEKQREERRGHHGVRYESGLSKIRDLMRSILQGAMAAFYYILDIGERHRSLRAITRFIVLGADHRPAKAATSKMGRLVPLHATRSQFGICE